MGDAGPSPATARWFGRLAKACEQVAAEALPLSPAQRREVTGSGAGGDPTTRIDRIAEDVLLAAISAGAEADGGVAVVSEEVGSKALGADTPVIVVDPIDGSLNAKRGLPWFSSSIAIVDGPRMSDIRAGYVHDFATGNVFTAEAGGGAWLNGQPLRSPDSDGLRVVALEGAEPARLARALPHLGATRRLRLIGSLALSLCATAAGWVDGMAGLGAARTVDVAAGMLIAREAGAAVSFIDPDDPAEIGLGIEERFWVAAALRADDLPLLRETIAAADA